MPRSRKTKIAATLSRERRRVEPVSLEVFSRFADTVIGRLDDQDIQLERLNGILFVDTEERPSFASLSKLVDTHIKVMCGWAAVIKRIALLITGACAGIAAVIGALSALGIRIF